MTDEKLHDELRVLSCNWQITHTLLQELIAVLPQREQVLQRFQQAIENLSQGAPKHIDPEYLVELRARAALTLGNMRSAPPSAM
jgi:hypothetical protein